MWERLKSLIELGLDSESNFIRRGTILATMPPVAVACIGINGFETACEWVKDTAVEVDGMKGDLVAIWNAPRG